MKRVLITGGTGTVGTAFIKKYYSKYKFYNVSRNENNIAELKQNYPKVESHVGDILDLEHLINIFEQMSFRKWFNLYCNSNKIKPSEKILDLPLN